MKISVYGIETQVGIIKVYFDEDYIYYVHLPRENEKSNGKSEIKYFDRYFDDYEIIENNVNLTDDVKSLEKYFNKDIKNLDDIKIKTYGTEFQHKVWDACRSIGYGEIASYKDLSDIINNKGYQAIGGALNKNPIPIIIPCHRIIGKNGDLVGFEPGLDLKKYLLNLEEITIL